jgi:hypothetical protein
MPIFVVVPQHSSSVADTRFEGKLDGKRHLRRESPVKSDTSGLCMAPRHLRGHGLHRPAGRPGAQAPRQSNTLIMGCLHRTAATGLW